MSRYRLLVDSSIWVSYFIASTPEVADAIDSEENLLYTSAVTLHEVKRKLLRMKYTRAQADRVICFIIENSIIIPVDKNIALQSVTHCIEHKLHTIDAIIYETSQQSNCTLITGDNDFKKLKNTNIIT